MYSTLEEAGKEILRRWSDLSLRKKVEEFLADVPEALGQGPCAVMYRQITTPNTEFHHFLHMAKQINLTPVSLEYLEDKFVTTNSCKLSWGKMAFYQGRNRNGEAIFYYKIIIDFFKSDGKKFKEIKTLWGESFVDFHHRILGANPSCIKILDFSSWYKKRGGNATDYYPYILSLFICHGILFENFLMYGKESKFTHEIVKPSFKKVEEYFGVKPLIVPLVPHDEVSDKYWWCYPEYIEKEIFKESKPR